MYSLNDKIKNLQPYEPVEENYRIRLDANESFLALPEGMISEIGTELKNVVLNRYPDPTARELCKAFAELYALPVECVVAGNGSDELISVIMSGFLKKGEKYATLEPDFSMYSFYGNICEAEHIRIEKNADLQIDIDTSINLCKNNDVKLLIFSNPCNPTSLGVSKAEVKKLLLALPETLIALDEAYMEFWHESMVDELSNYSNLIILKTCSKAFGLAGIRLGFAASSKQIIDAIKAVKSPYNVNSLTQAVGRVVLSHKDEISKAIGKLLASANELHDGMIKLAEKSGTWKILDGHTNFVSVLMPNAENFLSYMQSSGVSIRYTCGLIRITCGTAEENKEVLRLAEEYLA